MLESLSAFNVVTQALVATTATYLLTAVGTLPVLFFKSAPRRLMDAMMGFAAGVMVAASCWSLLVPAIDRGGVMQASIGMVLVGHFCISPTNCFHTFMVNSRMRQEPRDHASRGSGRRS